MNKDNIDNKHLENHYSWTSVNDKMPKEDFWVLIHLKYLRNNSLAVAHLDTKLNCWRTIEGAIIDFRDVDYWLYIPEVPETKEQ